MKVATIKAIDAITKKSTFPQLQKVWIKNHTLYASNSYIAIRIKSDDLQHVNDGILMHDAILKFKSSELVDLKDYLIEDDYELNKLPSLDAFFDKYSENNFTRVNADYLSRALKVFQSFNTNKNLRFNPTVEMRGDLCYLSASKDNTVIEIVIVVMKI